MKTESVALHSGTPSLEAFGAAAPILLALFNSPVVGVSLIDRMLRFQAINPSLATMNGLAPERHIGQNLRSVLGNAARKVQGAIDQVLQSSQPVCNLQLTAKLPLRQGIGHWVESYVPVHDSEGSVTHVLVLVLEITPRRRMQRSLSLVLENLSRVSTAMKSSKSPEVAGGEIPQLIMRSAGIVEACISETRKLDAISTSLLEALPPARDLRAVSGTRGTDERLTGQEQRVLQLLAEAKSNKEIAWQLDLSVRTIETYRARIMAKLGIHSVAELVRYAIRCRIIQI